MKIVWDMRNITVVLGTLQWMQRRIGACRDRNSLEFRTSSNNTNLVYLTDRSKVCITEVDIVKRVEESRVGTGKMEAVNIIPEVVKGVRMQAETRNVPQNFLFWC